ncbi:unnamed protein product [Symbiodinium pilosum]|uniref:GYF domain-containing protein n=1 Tax=Symbiodinium pilosum TaxID=2952 RepID=A0A812T7E5_SYMPI|nr:unnamed protein product [Symbiodinium pilosum]
MPAAFRHTAPQYPCLSAEEAASRADDHGRKLHELRWLYLDSVGQEYGPLPGWTMQEWLTMGRFPVGLDLRVRLPEWDRHLPLRQIFPDLSAAFRLPPAWPEACQDKSAASGGLEVEELRRSIRESGRMSGPFQACASSSPALPTTVPNSSVSFAPVSTNGSASKPHAEAVNGGAKAPRPERNKIPEQARDPLPLPPRESILLDREELPPLPKAQYVLERLLEEEEQQLRLNGQTNGAKDSGRLFLEKVARGAPHKVNGTNGTNGTNGKVEADRLTRTNGNGTAVAMLQH